MNYCNYYNCLYCESQQYFPHDSLYDSLHGSAHGSVHNNDYDDKHSLLPLKKLQNKVGKKRNNMEDNMVHILVNIHIVPQVLIPPPQL